MNTIGANNSKLNNAIWVFITNLICLLTTLAIGVLFPKFVSTATFAYYRTYTLYVTYVGLFHFGMINGIYLKYGSYSYSNLPKESFKSYTKVLLFMQLLVSLVFLSIIIGMMGMSHKSIPLIFVVINSMFINMNAYFSLINQFTLHFKIDSIMQLLTSILNILVFVGFILSNKNNVISLFCGITLSNFLITIFWMILNKDILDIKASINKEVLIESKSFIKTGFFIMFSEFTGLIIFSIDSLFVNLFFENLDFAIYTFAVSVITVLMQIINLGSKLIFPYLKRTKAHIIKKAYQPLSILVIWFSGFISGSLFIINLFVDKFLEEYHDSIVLIYFLGVILIFRGPLELVFGNMYKITGLVKEYWQNNIIALAMGIATNAIAIILWGSLLSIAIASVTSYWIWFIITGTFFSKKLNYGFRHIFIFSQILVFTFLICTNLGVMGGFIYYSYLVLILPFVLKSIKTI